MLAEITTFVILMLIFWLVFSAILILAMIFWIMMLIDVIKRDFSKENDKIVWLLVIIFLGIIGAIVYYFVVKKEDKK